MQGVTAGPGRVSAAATTRRGKECGTGVARLPGASGGSRPVVYLAGRSLGRPAKAEAAPGGVRGEGRDAWPRGVGVALEGQG